jgi:hypothetical protein
MQEDWEFQASWGYIATPWLKKKQGLGMSFTSKMLAKHEYDLEVDPSITKKKKKEKMS